MPIHDWTRVDAGIFHDFHQAWIYEIKQALNRGLLPRGYYALSEQHGAGFQPDVLTLKTGTPAPERTNGGGPGPDREATGGGVLLAEPRVRVRAESDLSYYRRKQNVVAVRHVSGDELVAVVEIVSKANKAAEKPFEQFVRKAAELITRDIHLLILDLQPPTSRDPQGIHGAIWGTLTGERYERPADKPLTLAAYESCVAIRAYVEPVAVGDPLIDMPLFLASGTYVPVPLARTYAEAYESVPERWRAVIEAR